LGWRSLLAAPFGVALVLMLVPTLAIITGVQR
jgi:hypothetical protein